ncbi:MAG: DUF2378 family protein [Archangium sp.]
MRDTRVVFGSGFDSLFSADLRKRVTPKLDAALREIGVRLDKPFNAGYPVETWAQTLELTSKHLYGELPRPEAYRQLGRVTIDGFEHTFLGKAAFPMLRLIGIARSVERASRNYASTNNYTKVVLTRLSPTSFDFHLNEKHTPPQYDMGVVERMLEVLKAKDTRVVLQSQDAEGFVMRLSWTE